MSKEDRDNILDQHKEVYNGYTMQNQTSSNQQPLYVQDFANDKLGVNLDIHGNAKPYTNFKINESHSGIDMIGDGDVDLKNGTVDFEDVLSHNDDYDFGFDYPEVDSYENNVMVGDNDDETIYVSLGEMDDMIGSGKHDLKHGTFDNDDDTLFDDDDTLFDDEEYEYNAKEKTPKFDHHSLMSHNKFKEKDEREIEDFFDSDEIGIGNPVEDDEVESLMESVNKSLEMFRRLKKY
jgi:hypothetical protein